MDAFHWLFLILSSSLPIVYLPINQITSHSCSRKRWCSRIFFLSSKKKGLSLRRYFPLWDFVLFSAVAGEFIRNIIKCVSFLQSPSKGERERDAFATKLDERVLQLMNVRFASCTSSIGLDVSLVQIEFCLSCKFIDSTSLYIHSWLSICIFTNWAMESHFNCKLVCKPENASILFLVELLWLPHVALETST